MSIAAKIEAVVRTQMGRRSGVSAAFIAFATTLMYAAMKVVMAIEGKLGLPGFPASDESSVNRPDIGRDEWMLVSMALVAAAVALLMVLPWGARIPRWILAAALWTAGISQAAGALGMTLRATRILPDLGPGPQGVSTWMVLLVLDIGAIAWIISAMHATRHGHPAADDQRVIVSDGTERGSEYESR